MKEVKRIMVAAAAAVMALTAAGCSSSSSSSSSKSSSKVYKIGICQPVQHEALDAATKGFKEEVTKELGKSHVKFDTQNAQGDSSTATTICNNFASENEDLILANATASLQAASVHAGISQTARLIFCSFKNCFSARIASGQLLT